MLLLAESNLRDFPSALRSVLLERQPQEVEDEAVIVAPVTTPQPVVTTQEVEDEPLVTTCQPVEPEREAVSVGVESKTCLLVYESVHAPKGMHAFQGPVVVLFEPFLKHYKKKGLVPHAAWIALETVLNCPNDDEVLPWRAVAHPGLWYIIFFFILFFLNCLNISLVLFFIARFNTTIQNLGFQLERNLNHCSQTWFLRQS